MLINTFKTMNRKKTIPALLAAIAVSGCGLMPPEPKILYSGPQRDLTQVASISEGARLFLQVLKVDGQYIVDPLIGGARFTKGIHVLPGEHLVQVRYRNVTSFSLYGTSTVEYSIADVNLHAEAGRSYVLFGEPSGDKYRFWFVDKGLNYNQNCLLDENFVKTVIRHEAVPGC